MMKTLYVVYRNETLIGIVSNEEDGWGVVALDEIDKKNEKLGIFTDYRVKKIYTNLECG